MDVQRAIAESILWGSKKVSQKRLEDLPYGCVIGSGVLIDIHEIDEDFVHNLPDREFNIGDFRPGRYAWEFADMSPLDKPIPMNGKQGIWEWGK